MIPLGNGTNIACTEDYCNQSVSHLLKYITTPLIVQYIDALML